MLPDVDTNATIAPIRRDRRGLGSRGELIARYGRGQATEQRDVGPGHRRQADQSQREDPMNRSNPHDSPLFFCIAVGRIHSAFAMPALAMRRWRAAKPLDLGSRRSAASEDLAVDRAQARGEEREHARLGHGVDDDVVRTRSVVKFDPPSDSGRVRPVDEVDVDGQQRVQRRERELSRDARADGVVDAIRTVRNWIGSQRGRSSSAPEDAALRELLAAQGALTRDPERAGCWLVSIRCARGRGAVLRSDSVRKAPAPRDEQVESRSRDGRRDDTVPFGVERWEAGSRGRARRLPASTCPHCSPGAASLPCDGLDTVASLPATLASTDAPWRRAGPAGRDPRTE